MRLPGRKSAIAGGVLILLLALPFLLIPALVDAEKVANQLKAAVKQRTGFDLMIEGSSTAYLGRGVSVRFDRVHIPPTGNGAGSLLSAERLILHVGLFSTLFTDDPQIFAVEIVHPVVAVEINEQGTQSWNAQPKGIHGTLYHLSKTLSFGTYLERLSVNQGILSFSDARTGHIAELKDLDLDFIYTANPAVMTLDGGFTYGEKPYRIAWRADTGDAIAVDAVLSQGQSRAAFKGTLAPASAEGELTAETNDLWPWLKEFYSIPPRQGDIAGRPFSLSGPVEFTDSEVIFKQVSFSQGKTKGALTLRAIKSEEARWAASMKLDIDTLDANALLGFHHAVTDHAKSTQKRQPGEPLALLPEDAVAAADLSIGRILLLGGEISGLSARLELLPDQVVLNDLRFTTAGESVFSGMGVLAETPDGFSFDAGFDTEGKSLRTFVTGWRLLKDAPQNSYEAYRARFRAFISADEVRIYEARIESGAAGAAGALIFSLGQSLKVNAALGLKGVDLDSWYQTLFPKKSLSAAAGSAPALPDFGWLRNAAQIVGNIRIDDFALAGREGETASFQLQLRPGELSLRDFTANYAGSLWAGNLGLVAEERPKLSATLTVDRLEAKDLIALTGFGSAYSQQTALLDSSVLTFPYLGEFQGNAKLSISDFMLGAVPMQDAEMEFSLAGEKLMLTLQRGRLWDGTISANGVLTAGAVPAFAFSCIMTDFDLARGMEFAGGWRNYGGRASAKLELGTSGLKISDWMTGWRGNIGLAARDVEVKGLDLATLVGNAAQVRTVADIKRVTQSDLLNGSTVFTSIDGNFPVQNSVVQPDRAKLILPYSTGVLTGSYSLLAKTVDMAAQFVLRTLDADAPPTLGLVIKGDASAPAVTLDTRALEAYIARRSAQEMLGPR